MVFKKDTTSSLADILASKKPAPKAPAYRWQDLALRVIQELGIPAFKKNSVFKVCRDLPAAVVLRAMNDTKELAAGGAQWKYFFKVIDTESKPKKPDEAPVLETT